MLAKVITLSHSTGGSFGAVMKYIMKATPESQLPEGQQLEAGDINVDPSQLYWTPEENNLAYAEDLAATCDSTADECRLRGRFNGNPVYHVALNWKEGEHPTKDQAVHACAHVMKALGFQDHQAAWAIHRDTDNDHVHLVVNRVHPTRHVAISPPFKKDYEILDRCMRELEIEFGHGRANGPYITLDAEAGPTIVRMSRAERRERGLLKDDGPRISDRACRAEKNLGAGDSFQSWVAGAPAADLKATVNRPGATWAEAHAILAEHGCCIQSKGSGMVVTTTLDDGRVLAAKASQLGRWVSKAELEKKLGPYSPPQALGQSAQSHARPDYAEHVENQRRDAETRAGRGQKTAPGRTNEALDRDVRRHARAQARQELADRFKADQAHLKDARPKVRQELRERHAEERKQLLANQRAQRRSVRQAARLKGIDPGTADSIWAFQSARDREILQKRQAAERKALTAKIPRAEVWRTWLEKQADAGDEAAKAALRGIRYREQRAKGKTQDGIEGEELDPLRKFTVAALQAEIDHRRQLVIYKGQDGKEKFTDTGPRIVMHDKAADSLEAALRIAAQKYGGKVDITGSSEFRDRAARQAVRLGITVTNDDLAQVVADEKVRMQAGRGPRQLSPITGDKVGDKSSKSVQQQPEVRMPKYEATNRDLPADQRQEPPPAATPKNKYEIDHNYMAASGVLVRLDYAAWDTLLAAGRGQSLTPDQRAQLCNGVQSDLVDDKNRLTPLGQATHDLMVSKIKGDESQLQQAQPAQEPAATLEARPSDLSKEPEPAVEKIRLAVPYKEKEEAKALGAVWDKADRAWYAKPGADMKALEKWVPAPGAEQQQAKKQQTGPER